MLMVSYMIRRLLIGIFTVWVVSILSFIIIQLPPGDAISTQIAKLEQEGDMISDAEAEALRRQYGLDRPLYVQYTKWVIRFAQGEFGNSMLYKMPVKDVISDRLGMTVIVTLASVLVSWMLSLPIGIYSAVNQYSFSDYFFTLLGFIGLAVPNFLIALLVMYLAYAHFDIRVGGLFSSVEMFLAPWSVPKVLDLLKHLWLPALLLGFSGMAGLLRIMRNNLLDELNKPYVITARAKGLSESKVILKYPVRVALNPFVSTIGYILPEIVSGSVIVAIVLGLPTLGPTLFSALVAQDMYLAGTIILLISIMTVIGTFISDILLAWLDPRIRLDGS
jgi:peptide/nickel transport system permease protein